MLQTKFQDIDLDSYYAELKKVSKLYGLNCWTPNEEINIWAMNCATCKDYDIFSDKLPWEMKCKKNC